MCSLISHTVLTRAGYIILIMICIVILVGVEKIIGWALSHHFMQSSEASVKNAKLVISSER